MKSLFVMDPLDRIVVDGDSTFVMMRECTDRGYPVWMCAPSDLYSRDGRVSARVTPVRTTAEAPCFHPEVPEVRDLGDFDVVWMRKDPPFDMAYVFTTYLLDMAPTVVMNGPQGLKLFNEKMWVQQQWPHYQPATLITNNTKRLAAFVADQPGRTALKPWDGNGGRGVLITQCGDRNLNSMLDLLTAEGRDYVIAQAYIAAVDQGDKRILLFDGEPVGAMLRIPQANDFRANMHVGARVAPCELDARDREICAALGPELRRWGQMFVGIDVIDGYLTEINVTSPTGIREINRLYGFHLEGDLMDRVESRLKGEN